MTINGTELEFNILDAQTAEKYENLIDQVSKKEKPTGTKLSEVIKAECKKVYDFFDALFGEGTSEKVFEGKQDLEICLNAFSDLIAEAGKQTERIGLRAARYSPARAQRKPQK